MSYSDFCQCTPSEFRRIYDAWQIGERKSWEQARFVAKWSISPWAKDGLKATDLVTFPWDEETRPDKGETLTPEARAERRRKAAERRGLTCDT